MCNPLTNLPKSDTIRSNLIKQRITMAQCKDCGKAISKKATRCWSCAAKARRARGDYDSPETKRKFSDGTKARWVSGDFDGIFDNPETKRKMSETTKASWARGDFDSPETRRKRSESAKAARARGDYDSPETHRRLSESAKTRRVRGDYDDPEYRRKMSEAAKATRARGVYDSPETRHKLSVSTKARWANGDFDNIFTDEYWAAQSERMSGEKNPNWRGGVSFEPYGLEWTDKLRKTIRKRDNHTCVISGKVWQEGQDEFPVHHINYDKADSRPNNLITLCYDCHRKTNSNRRHWQTLLTPIAGMRAFVELESGL